MKFVRLDLQAFGPFTNRTLEFANKGPNLHLIYGPNEAGKSTTRRAIIALLYGIEKNTGDAHVHAMTHLRVGATLEHSSGEQRVFVRKKGNQGTLLDSAEKPLDESALRTWLSITDRKHFEQMFGLDHEQLREAGAALSDAKTDVGRMLFGALLDGTTLHQTLTRLDGEADKLLSPSGSAGAISKALSAWREQVKKSKEISLPAREWDALQAKIEATHTQNAELLARIKTTQTERHRLERLQRALPWLRQRTDAEEQLRSMGEVQLLAIDIDSQRRERVQRMESARTNHRRIEAEMARTQHERNLLAVPETLALAGARIKQLNEELGKYKAEQHDIPSVIKEIVMHRNEQRELLRQLGLSHVEPKAVASVRVDEAAFERVRVLEHRGVEIQTRLRSAQTRIVQQRALIAQREADSATSSMSADTVVLQSVWEQLRPDKTLPARIREAETHAASLETRVTMAHATLGFWSGPVAQCVSLRVPLEETIRQHELDESEDERARKDLRTQRLARARELDDIHTRIEQLRASGQPLTEQQLAQVRVLRDRAWEGVVRAWQSGLAPTAADDSLYAGVSISAAYLMAVRSADDCADQLRSNATRVAEYASLQRQEEHARIALESLTHEELALEERIEARASRWKLQWLPCGFTPGSAREMLAWHRRFAALLEAVRQHTDSVLQCEALRKSLRDQQRELVEALKHAGTAVPEETPWLSLLANVEHTLKRAHENTAQKASAHKDLLSAQHDLTEQLTFHADCERELEQWKVEWGAAVERFHLPATALFEEARTVLGRFTELFRLEEKCERQEKRQQAIEKQSARFKASVMNLSAELATEIAAGFAGDTDGPQKFIGIADALIEQHHLAAKAEERRRTLDEQLSNHARDLDDARITLEAEQRQLDALLSEAGCSNIPSLDEAVEHSNRARHWMGLRTEAEKRLSEVGEGWSIDALTHAAVGTDSDRLAGEIAALEETLNQLEIAQHEQMRTMGALQEEQKKYSGTDDAARALTEAHEHLSVARSHAERYARLRLASVLLRRGVENYRQHNEGAILQRASRLFEKLTLHRYQQLRVHYEGNKARLRCMRGAESVEVESALSDGTLDQLYLALRVASLEQHLQSQEPMPLVLDDIFIHFDDDRTRAGLQVLAELSSRTQVLLLTHHARNLELARTALPAGSWQEHHLETP